MTHYSGPLLPEVWRDVAAARLAMGVAAYSLNVAVSDIASQERGSQATAFARQVAMYLCHVAFEHSLSRIAIAFGRDRSTVAHACHVVEDRREDEGFDALIAAMESTLRRAPQPDRALLREKCA